MALITIFFGGKQTVKNKKVFQYTAKDCFMTATEKDFFQKLYKVAGEKYYIFPQAHLSSILNHKVTGQPWKGAFSHINGKSVDYVLCDKTTLKPVYGVELDDYTHEYSNRQERDKEVERMFQCANIPLVRFSSANVSEEEIENKFIESRNN